MDKVELGQRLVYWRRQRGLTQDEVAQHVGLTASGLTRIEKGQTDVPFMRLLRIAEVLDVPMAELLYRDVLRQPNAPSITELEQLATVERKQLRHPLLQQLQQEIDMHHQQLLEKELLASRLGDYELRLSAALSELVRHNIPPAQFAERLQAVQRQWFDTPAHEQAELLRPQEATLLFALSELMLDLLSGYSDRVVRQRTDNRLPPLWR
jgi:transcriptional regulator with XRE-family HTH domain